jgi:hypothetical protein
MITCNLSKGSLFTEQKKMPISEKRKEFLKRYRSAQGAEYKRKQRIAQQKYVQRHPEYAKYKHDNYIARKTKYIKFVELEGLITTLECEESLTYEEKYNKLIAVFHTQPITN